MRTIGIVVLICILQGVVAPGVTKLCRNCNHAVSDPSECMQFHKCHEACATDVYLNKHGEYQILYSCRHEPECHDVDHHPDPGHHVHGKLVCGECCYTAGCEQYSCSQYLRTTPLPTTTTTTTAAPPTTSTARSVMPSATTKLANASTAQPTASLPCVDHDATAFPCADMIYFGYCNPSAGAGYALAQKQCRASCGFCV